MKIDQLEYFIVASESKSFSDAAEQLFISQQAFSKSISSLESELGVKLFRRAEGGSSLTRVGRQLKPIVAKLVDNYHSSVELIKTIAEASASVVRVAFENSVSMSYCPYELLSTIGDIRVSSYIAGGVDRCIYDLQEERCDIAIATNVDDPKGMELIPLYEFRLQCIVDRTHPFSTRCTVSIEDMKNEKHIWITEESSGADSYLKACLDHGFYPRIIAEYPNTDMVLEAVSERKGVTVAAGFDMPQELDLARVPFSEEDLMLKVAILARPDYRNHLEITSIVNAIEASTPIASM